ncbi:MAG: Uma2 family endonuclease [Planctomycetes bacterium]|nr:Uma2 family endonuclease [Planctomycetota bacterium]
MSTIAVPEDIRIPTWVVDLESFRRWARSDEFPERGRFSHLAGGLWVDLSMETLGHNEAKAEISAVLRTLVKAQKLGRFFVDRMRLTNAEAELSTEPDAMFASRVARITERTRYEHGAASLEVEGTVDMVLEVVSPSSVQKDTVVLRELYWKAGVREYWLVDPRGLELHFDILRHTPKGYVATSHRGGWLKSAVFDKSFRLTRGEDDQGDPEFTLEVR